MEWGILFPLSWSDWDVFSYLRNIEYEGCCTECNALWGRLQSDGSQNGVGWSNRTHQSEMKLSLDNAVIECDFSAHESRVRTCEFRMYETLFIQILRKVVNVFLETNFLYVGPLFGLYPNRGYMWC